MEGGGRRRERRIRGEEDQRRIRGEEDQGRGGSGGEDDQLPGVKWKF